MPALCPRSRSNNIGFEAEAGVASALFLTTIRVGLKGEARAKKVERSEEAKARKREKERERERRGENRGVEKRFKPRFQTERFDFGFISPPWRIHLWPN